MGNSSGSASPSRTNSSTTNSVDCPPPWLSIKVPTACTAAPVLSFLRRSSGVWSLSTTHWRLCKVDPSFTAKKRSFRNVRTHPHTLYVWPVAEASSRLEMGVRERWFASVMSYSKAWFMPRVRCIHKVTTGNAQAHRPTDSKWQVKRRFPPCRPAGAPSDGRMQQCLPRG